MKKVVVYALSTCPWCRKTKQFLKDNKIEFEFVDYDLAKEKEQERILSKMKRFGGGSSFPFVIVGEEAVEGYDPERLSQLLDILDE
jgi:glutaredoxin